MAEEQQQPYSELSITGLNIGREPQEAAPSGVGTLTADNYHPIASIATLDSYELYFEPDDDVIDDLPPHIDTGKTQSESSLPETLPTADGHDEMLRPIDTASATHIKDHPVHEVHQMYSHDASEPTLSPAGMPPEYQLTGDLSTLDISGEFADSTGKDEDYPHEGITGDIIDSAGKTNRIKTATSPDITTHYSELNDRANSLHDETIEDTRASISPAIGSLDEWDDELLNPINIEIDHSGFSDFSDLPDFKSNKLPAQNKQEQKQSIGEYLPETDKSVNIAPDSETVSENEKTPQKEQATASGNIQSSDIDNNDILADIPSAFSLYSNEELPEIPEDNAHTPDDKQAPDSEEPELYQRAKPDQGNEPPEWIPPEEIPVEIPPEVDANLIREKIGAINMPAIDTEGIPMATDIDEDVEDEAWDKGEDWEELLDAGHEEALAEKTSDTPMPDMSEVISDLAGDEWGDFSTSAQTAEDNPEDSPEHADWENKGTSESSAASWMDGNNFQLELPEEEDNGEFTGEWHDEEADSAPDNPNGLSQSTLEYLQTFEKIRRSVPTKKEFTQATREWLRLLHSIKGNIQEAGFGKGTVRWLDNIRKAIGIGASGQKGDGNISSEYGDDTDFTGAEISEDDFFPQASDGSVIKSSSSEAYIVDDTAKAAPQADENDSNIPEGDTWGLNPEQQAAANEATDSGFDDDIPPDDMLPDDDFSFSTADMLMEDEDLGLNDLESEFDFGSSGGVGEEEKDELTDIPGIKGKLLRVQRFARKWGKLLYKYVDGYANFHSNWWRYLDFLALVILTVALAQLAAYIMWYM